MLQQRTSEHHLRNQITLKIENVHLEMWAQGPPYELPFKEQGTKCGGRSNSQNKIFNICFRNANSYTFPG